MASIGGVILAAGILHSIGIGCFGAPRCELVLRSAGKALYCHQTSGELLITRLSAKQEFQGFGLIDVNTVFFAHTDGDSEPGTTVSVFYLKERKARRIGALGATTDAVFEVSPERDVVAFNWYNGVYIFSIRRAIGLPENANLYTAFEGILLKVAACQRCERPHWIDANTLAFIELAGGQRIPHRVTIPIPSR